MERVQVFLRLPKELHGKVRDEAKRERRTIIAHIEYILSSHFERQDQAESRDVA